MAEQRTSVTLQLTELQRELLPVVLDMHIEGTREAKNSTIQDHSLPGFEALLELTDDFDTTVAALEDVQRQLERQNGDSSSGLFRRSTSFDLPARHAGVRADVERCESRTL